MKTILAPTDFSAGAENAVNYAVEMAKQSGARLILFHSFHVPFVEPGVAALMPSLEELEKEMLADLEMIANQLRLASENEVVIECKCTWGFAADEISDCAKECKADLIVLGMQGAGYLAERLLGSVTTSLVQKTTCPVLIISEKVKFRMLKRIALASDLEQENGAIAPLREIAQMFNAHVYIINVVEDLVAVPSSPLEISDFGSIAAQLKPLKHSFHFCEGENVVEGLKDFIAQHNIDMVAMIPGKHSALSRIFHEPNTKRMAFHTEVPMLVLNKENSTNTKNN